MKKNFFGAINDGPGCPFIEVNNKDVLENIMKYLTAKDVVALGTTCEKMRVLSNSENVWFHLLMRDYGVQKDPIFDEKTLNKEIYKQEKNFEQMRVSDWFLTRNLGKILCFSCEHGMIEVTKSCIRRGGNIDQVNNIGWTALMCASWYGYTSVVELLLNADANIDQVNNGWTALMYASCSGHTSVVELLLNSGAEANINQVNKFGSTALMLASCSGHTSVVELLLNSGADAKYRPS